MEKIIVTIEIELGKEPKTTVTDQDGAAFDKFERIEATIYSTGPTVAAIHQIAYSREG